jgi:uncharacterized caspase-like protein
MHVSIAAAICAALCGLVGAAALAQNAAPPPAGQTPPAAEERRGMQAIPDPSRPEVSGRRTALVIGNSSYRHAPVLKNPRRDAEAVAGALRRAGFQTVATDGDLDRERLLNAVQAFSREADNADWAVIYFAGHGIEVGGTNYLVPVDARLRTDRDALFEAVPLDLLFVAAEGARGLRLVLIDACRDNPFVRTMRRTVASRSVGTGLAPAAPNSGTLVVYATKHGDVALDGEGDNSPFAASLARRLPTPGLDIRQILNLVRDDVLREAKLRQSPFAYGSIGGSDRFVFVQK